MWTLQNNTKKKLIMLTIQLANILNNTLKNPIYKTIKSPIRIISAIFSNIYIKAN